MTEASTVAGISDIIATKAPDPWNYTCIPPLTSKNERVQLLIYPPALVGKADTADPKKFLAIKPNRIIPIRGGIEMLFINGGMLMLGKHLLPLI